MGGGDKRLNFNQPLLSVRRGSSTTTLPEVVDTLTTTPCCDNKSSELDNCGPIRNPGLVPFLWEQIPGRRKDDSDTLSKGCSTTDGSLINHHEEDDDSNYLDAVDTLSRSDSLLNCSLSGLSSDPNGKNLSAQEEEDIMMGRFLPASQAVALDRSCSVSRKQQQPPPLPVAVKDKQPARDVKSIIVNKAKYKQRKNYRLPESLLSHHHPRDEDDEEEDSGRLTEEEHSSSAAAKLCGLLPRFCLLNPVVPGLIRHPAPVSLSSSVQKKRTNVVCGAAAAAARRSIPIRNENKAIVNAVYERRRMILHQRSKQQRFGGNNMAAIGGCSNGNNLKNQPKKPVLPFDTLLLGSLNCSSLSLEDEPSSKELVCYVGKNNGSSGGGGAIPPYRRSSSSSRSRGGSSLMQQDKGFLGVPEPKTWPVKRTTSTTRNARLRELVLHKVNSNSINTDEDDDDDEQPPSSRSRSCSSYRSSSSAVVKTLYIDNNNSAEHELTSSRCSSRSVATDESRGRNPSVDYSLQGLLCDVGFSGAADDDDDDDDNDKPPMSRHSRNKSAGCEVKPRLDSSNSGGEVSEENLNTGGEGGRRVQGIGVLRLTDGHSSKEDEEEKRIQDMSLLLPLPRSPSESWLSRALPSSSGSFRHTHSRSFLGVGNQLGFRA